MRLAARLGSNGKPQNGEFSLRALHFFVNVRICEIYEPDNAFVNVPGSFWINISLLRFFCCSQELSCKQIHLRRWKKGHHRCRQFLTRPPHHPIYQKVHTIYCAESVSTMYWNNYFHVWRDFSTLIVIRNYVLFMWGGGVGQLRKPVKPAIRILWVK